MIQVESLCAYVNTLICRKTVREEEEEARKMNMVGGVVI